MSQDFWTPSISSPSIGRINVKELEVQALPGSSFEVEVTQHFDAEVILDTEAGNQIRALMTGTLSTTMDRSDPMPWVPENCRMPVKTSPSIPPIRFLKIPENLVDAETEEPIKPLPLSQKIKAELAQQVDWRESIIEAMPEITIDTIEDVLDAAAEEEGAPLPEPTDEATGEPGEAETAQTSSHTEEDQPQANSAGSEEMPEAELPEAQEAEAAKNEEDGEDLMRFDDLDNLDEDLERIMKDIEEMPEPTDDMPAPTQEDDIQQPKTMAAWAESGPTQEQAPNDTPETEPAGEIDMSDDWASEDEDEMKLADTNTDTEGTTESYSDDDDDDLLRFDDDDEEETEGQGPSLTSFAEPEPESEPEAQEEHPPAALSIPEPEPEPTAMVPEASEPEPVEPVAPYEPESEEYRTIVLNNDRGVDLGIRAGIHCGKVVRETAEGVDTVYDLYKSRAGRLLVHENEAWIHEISTDNLSELFDLLGYEPDAKEAYERAGVNCIRWID